MRVGKKYDQSVKDDALYVCLLLFMVPESKLKAN